MPGTVHCTVYRYRYCILLVQYPIHTVYNVQVLLLQFLIRVFELNECIFMSIFYCTCYFVKTQQEFSTVHVILLKHSMLFYWFCFPRGGEEETKGVVSSALSRPLLLHQERRRSGDEKRENNKNNHHHEGQRKG